MHDVLGKIRASGKELLALCTLVLPLGFAMSLSNMLLQVFHHLKALGALTPLIQMHGAHVLLQCSACGFCSTNTVGVCGFGMTYT